MMTAQFPGAYPPPPNQPWPPQGAYPPPQPPPAPPKRKWPWIVGGIIAFFVIVGSCSSNQAANRATTYTPSTTYTSAPTAKAAPTSPPPAAQAPPQAETKPEVIKVKTMGNDFEANQIAGEAKWGGRYIQFTAPVGNIDGNGGLSFTDITSQFSFTQVSCNLADTSGVVNLSKGKPATVRGVVNPNQFIGVITLDECELVK